MSKTDRDELFWLHVGRTLRDIDRMEAQEQDKLLHPERYPKEDRHETK